MDTIARQTSQHRAVAGAGRAGRARARSRLRRASPPLLHVLRTAVVAVALAGVAALAVGHVLGWSALIVRSGSMEPAVPVGSLVVARTIDPREVRLGDVVAIPRDLGGRQVLVLHRVVALSERDGLRQAQLRGDANPVPDPEPAVLDRPVARRVAVVPVAGYVIAGIRAALTPSRLLVLVLGALTLAAIWRRPGPRRDATGRDLHP